MNTWLFLLPKNIVYYEELTLKSGKSLSIETFGLFLSEREQIQE